MAQQSLTGFKTTTPDVGEARFLWSASTGPDTSVTASVIGMTISIYDCSSTPRTEAVANLTNFTIGDESLTLIDREAYGSYYYYDVSPTITTGSLADYESVCTLTSLTPPPKIDTFRNSPYNPAFNNALKLRGSKTKVNKNKTTCKPTKTNKRFFKTFLLFVKAQLQFFLFSKSYKYLIKIP